MNTKFLLPFAAVSALALAACGGDTPPPAQPEPDAGPAVVEEPAVVETPVVEAPVVEAPVVETPVVVVPEPTPAEEIQQEAEEAFQQIMEETQQAGDNLVEMGNNAMQSISNQIGGAGETLEAQIDGMITGLENMRDQNLTDEQKLQAVAGARAAAENAARLFGRSEADIASFGDSTEQRARAALGL